MLKNLLIVALVALMFTSVLAAKPRRNYRKYNRGVDVMSGKSPGTGKSPKDTCVCIEPAFTLAAQSAETSLGESTECADPGKYFADELAKASIDHYMVMADVEAGAAATQMTIQSKSYKCLPLKCSCCGQLELTYVSEKLLWQFADPDLYVCCPNPGNGASTPTLYTPHSGFIEIDDGTYTVIVRCVSK